MLRRVLLGAALVGALLACYHAVWHAGFIWDDDAHLTASPCIVGPLGLKGAWTTSAANYFPLVLTHFWVLLAWVPLIATAALLTWLAALASGADDTRLRTNYAVALLNIDRRAEAIEQFEAALRVDPNNRTAREDLRVLGVAASR